MALCPPLWNLWRMESRGMLVDGPPRRRSVQGAGRIHQLASKLWSMGDPHLDPSNPPRRV